MLMQLYKPMKSYKQIWRDKVLAIPLPTASSYSAGRPIEQQLRELDDCKRQVGELNTQADACLQHLLTTRRALTASRRNFVRDVLRGNRYVRIRVVPYGARETVESQFRQLLQREEGGFEKDIGSPNGEGLLGELYRSENGVTDVEKNLSNIKDKIGKIVLKQFEMGALADKRFATHVGKLPPETIDRLYLWFPEDSLEVQYSATDDEQDFRPIETGSPRSKDSGGSWLFYSPTARSR